MLHHAPAAVHTAVAAARSASVAAYSCLAVGIPGGLD